MPVRLCFRSEVRLSQGLSHSHSRLEQIVRFSRRTRSHNFETLKLQSGQFRIFEHILAQNVVKALAQNILQSCYCSWSERLCMVKGLVPISMFLVCLFFASLQEAQHKNVSSWFICLFSDKEFPISSLLTLTR